MENLIKKSFKQTSSFGPIHTGTACAITGNWLISCLFGQVSITDLSSGHHIQSLPGDGSDVTAVAVTSSPGFLLSAQRSQTLQLHTLPDLTPHKSIPKAHTSPVLVAVFDPTGRLFATGATDGSIKVWDAVGGFCTHVFTGHAGLISCLTFSIDETGGSKFARLISGSDDTTIRIWDLFERKCIQVLDGHSSAPTALDISPDRKTLLSGARDQVLNFWDVERGVLKRTIPVFETIEGAGFIDSGSLYTAGEKGLVRLWDYKTAQELPQSVRNKELQKGKPTEIVKMIYTPTTNTLTAFDVDQTIIRYDASTLAIKQQIPGYNDEIIDVAYLSESSLAVATNSPHIKIYNTSPDEFNTTILKGHTDLVLALDSKPADSLLASGSKDNTARIWVLKEKSKCIAVARGHVDSVGAVALSKASSDFLVTGSKDRCIKLWDLTSLNLTEEDDSESQEEAELKSLVTLKAHEKDINALDISPNDQLIATGSQDKTAKLFQVVFKHGKAGANASASLVSLGTFKGHKKGIWTIKFSSREKCLVTGSGDKTIKMWSLSDFTCLRTFESHTNSILRLNFFNNSTQLISACSDGLVKVWNIKDERCLWTGDAHEAKVWAVAVRADQSGFVTGGADSRVVLWEDVTELEEQEKMEELQGRILMEQDLSNYVENGDYSNAILLALELNQPKRLWKLFDELTRNADGSYTGSRSVDQVIKSLSGRDVKRLLLYINNWNTSVKTSGVAQLVLFCILKTHPAESLVSSMDSTPPTIDEPVENEEEEETNQKKQVAKKRAPKKELDTSEILASLIPYTERHLARLERLVDESFIIEHLLGQMDSLYDV